MAGYFDPETERLIDVIMDNNPGSWRDSSSWCEDGSHTVTIYTENGEHLFSIFLPWVTDEEENMYG